MDVNSVLSYRSDRSSTASKHKISEDGDVGSSKAKRSRGILTNEDKEKILKQVEEEDDEVESIDETYVKKLILNFEKKVYKNQENRIKHADLPEKFMESELELNDVLHEMHVLATVPEHHGQLVDLNAVNTLLQLLSHENTDISCATVELLQELTEAGAEQGAQEGVEEGGGKLVEGLLGAQVAALLVQNMERLDEGVKEEADAVHNSLGIIENLSELRPTACADIASNGVLSWLLKRIRAKMPFDGNKLYCSEVLAILLQESEENRRALGEMEGLDILLQQLNSYKRHDPSGNEEFECMENLFNCMCSVLMYPANRDKFMRGEGVQLMILLLREKKQSRNSAIKVLDHALSGSEGAENCQKFVDYLGLRCLFPLFMKTPKVNKKGLTGAELEEHIISIVCSMLRNCHGAQLERLMIKFVENDHEKVERLLELHFKYLDRVRVIDHQIEREKMRRRDIEDTEDEKDEQYIRRLDAGLFTLQLIDFIMLHISAKGPTTIKPRIMRILNMKGGSIKAIKGVMREYAGNIGDGKGDQAGWTSEQNKIIDLVDQF